jgi:hypothetical protein
MDERIKDHTRARSRGCGRGPRRQSAAHGRVDASHPGRAALRLYRCAPTKDLKSRIIAFSLAILVSLAAWGDFVYIAMHLIKK